MHRVTKILRLAIAVMCIAASSVGQQPSPVSSSSQPAPELTDVKEIIRRAIEADGKNDELAHNYTYQQHSVQTELDKDGKAKKQHSATHDITILYGEEYSRLIEKDGQPLSEKDARNEQEKLDKFSAKHKDETENDRRKRAEKEEKQRKQDRAFVQDALNAYDFTLLPSEQLEGHEVYVIEATPHTGFHPTQPHADILPKLKGRLWIDKQTYGLAKIEAESIDTISFGLFLARLHKGSHLTFEQTLVNNEVWLPRHVLFGGDARIMVFKNAAFQFDSTYSNYKKFTTATKILPGVKEAGTEQPRN